jgi:chromosome segregation ATPase
MLISQLKAHIFELEQHEKDYDNLNQKFRSIQNECSLLSEEKLRLEYELKQRTECLNKQILDLRTELENMQLNFNDKLVINKKLYNENNNLLKSLDLKSLENHDLKERLDELSDEYRRISEEKINLERMVHNLNDLKSTQKIEIGKLAEDNQRLIKICSDHEKQLKSMDTERIKLFSKIDELNFTLKNLNGKLASREENLGHINRQFDESKNLNIKLQQTVRDFEKQSDFQRGEIANLNNQLQKERNQRHDVDKELDNLKLVLMDRDKTINRYLTELDSSKNLNQRLNEEKMEVINDNGKMDGFISVLTKQNDDVRFK